MYRYAHHMCCILSLSHTYCILILIPHILQTESKSHALHTESNIYYILSLSHTSAASAAKQEADSSHPGTSSRIQAHQCGPTPGQHSSSAGTCELAQSVPAQTRPCMSAAQHAAAGRESPDAPELSCALL